MTKVEIHPGACGFSAIVTATEADPKKIRLTIETDCEHVKELSGKLEFLAIKDIYSHPFGEDKVYQAAKEASLHASCPVPCGIIKTAEAQFGLAVKKISFHPFHRLIISFVDLLEGLKCHTEHT